MTLAGAAAQVCRHDGGATACGRCIGEVTRLAATAAGVPLRYWILTRELGWSWASVAGGTPHLVPPEGDQGHCGRQVPRADRLTVRTGIAEHGCRACLAGAGIATPSHTTRS